MPLLERRKTAALERLGARIAAIEASDIWTAVEEARRDLEQAGPRVPGESDPIRDRIEGSLPLVVDQQRTMEKALQRLRQIHEAIPEATSAKELKALEESAGAVWHTMVADVQQIHRLDAMFGDPAEGWDQR